MKKIKFILFAFLLFPATVFAQKRVQFGPAVGIRISSAAGLDYSASSTAGLQFGLKTIVKLPGQWSLHFFPNLNLQGWEDKAPHIMPNGQGENIAYRSEQSNEFWSAELPAEAAYSWDLGKIKLSAAAGGQLSFVGPARTVQKTFFTSEGRVSEGNSKWSLDNQLNTYQFAASAGLSLQFGPKHRFLTDFRFYRSLSNLKKEGASENPHLPNINSAEIIPYGFSLTAGYLF